MDTVVSIQLIAPTLTADEVGHRMTAAMNAFHIVEAVCSRFDEASDVMRLTQQVGQKVAVHPILFEAIRFSVVVAEMTQGAFDPAIGRTLERHGFNRHYVTGNVVDTPSADEQATYRDVVIDEEARTVQLLRPLILDLGAVAKGLAIDLAARELIDCDGFVIDAGGDLYVSGRNERDEPWRVGIRHPSAKDELWCTVQVPEGGAICTSGDYERKSPMDPSSHHILQPASKASSRLAASCTVIGPYAMLADALSTAAFVLGPTRGIECLEGCDVHGLLITPALEQYTTKEMMGYIHG